MPTPASTGLSFDYADPRVVYATLERAVLVSLPRRAIRCPHFGTGIYRSVDGGATWRPVSATGLPRMR